MDKEQVELVMQHNKKAGYRGYVQMVGLGVYEVVITEIEPG